MEVERFDVQEGLLNSDAYASVQLTIQAPSASKTQVKHVRVTMYLSTDQAIDPDEDLNVSGLLTMSVSHQCLIHVLSNCLIHCVPRVVHVILGVGLHCILGMIGTWSTLACCVLVH